MKKFFSITAIMLLMILGVNAQTKKDGTPDMRYKANKETYGNTYSTPNYSTPKTERNYNNGGQLKMQNGYLKSNGSYVDPHLKTSPDNNKLNNKSTWNPK
jgi:hypothetical protein